MESLRFLKIVIICLLVVNIGTLSFIWLHHGHGGPPPPHGRGDVAGFLTHELNFSPEQEKQFDQLREEHHHAMEKFQDEGRERHHQLFDLLHASTADSAAIQSAAKGIAENQSQIEVVTFHHFQQVRAICNPEQQKKFDEIIDEALRMMAPGPHGPGR